MLSVLTDGKCRWPVRMRNNAHISCQGSQVMLSRELKSNGSIRIVFSRCSLLAFFQRNALGRGWIPGYDLFETLNSHPRAENSQS